MVELSSLLKPKDVLPFWSVRIRELNPRKPKDMEAARTLDQHSLDAIKPEAAAGEEHKPMTDEELKQWMKDSDHWLTRAIYKRNKLTYEPIGFANIYWDKADEAEYLTRISRVRQETAKSGIQLPGDEKIWELNFSVFNSPKDEIVASGVQQTIKEFYRKHGKDKALVMFVEDPLDPEVAQDLTVLKTLGFKKVADVPYAEGEEKINEVYYLAPPKSL